MIEEPSSLKLYLAGEDTIDAIAIAQMLNNTVSIVNEYTKKAFPNAVSRIKISPPKAGSFLLELFFFVIEHSQDIFHPQHIAIANILTKGMISFFAIKKHLQGFPPQSVETINSDEAKITNHRGNVYYSNCNVTNAYLNTPEIDRNMTEMVKAACIQGRESMSLENNAKEKAHIPKQDYSHMMQSIVMESSETIETHIETRDATLIVKKPDLLGNSAWQFISDGKNINAHIEDSDFLEKVHNRKIQFTAGVKIECKFTVAYQYDKKTYETIKDTHKYTIHKVYKIIPEHTEKLF